MRKLIGGDVVSAIPPAVAMTSMVNDGDTANVHRDYGGGAVSGSVVASNALAG